MTEKLSRRQMLKGLGLAMIGSALATCTPNVVKETVVVEKPVEKVVKETVVVEKSVEKVVTATPVPLEPASIRWAMWGDQTQQDLYQMAIDAFHERYPHIDITLEAIGYGEYHVKLLTSLSAGTASDIYAVARWYVPDYVEKGQVLDITSLLRADDEAQAVLDQDWPESYIDNVSWKGKIWGLPWGGGTYVQWWSRKLFQDAGLDDPYTQYKAGGWDWDDFLDMATELTQTDSSGKVQVYGCTFNYSWPYGCADWIWQAGGKGYDMSTDPPTIAMDSAETREALQFLHDLQYKYHVSPQPGETGDVDLVHTGRVALSISWDGMAANFNSEGNDFGIGPLPEGKAGRFAQGGCNPYFLNAATESPVEAWEFTKFLTMEAELMWVRTGNWAFIGPLSVLKSPAFLENYKAEPAEFVAENRQFNRAVPQPLGANECETVINRELDLFFLNEKSLDDALATIKAEGDAVLASAATS